MEVKTRGQKSGAKPKMKMSPSVKSSFWEAKTAEELTKEQGIKPMQDMSELTGYWPEGADFDAFYKAAVNSRKHASTN